MKKSLLYFALFVVLYLGVSFLSLAGLVAYANATGIDSDVLLDEPWVDDVGLSLVFVVSLAVFIRRPEVRRLLTVRSGYLGKACVWAALAALCFLLVESPVITACGLDGVAGETVGGLTSSVLALPLGCVLWPFVEEIVFRGAMTGSLLDRRCNTFVTLAVPSLLFAAMHLILELAPFYFAHGLVLGWLVVRTGSLWPSIVFHAANNIVCAVADIAFPDAAACGETTFATVRWALAAVGAAGLALCIMKLNKMSKAAKFVSRK